MYRPVAEQIYMREEKYKSTKKKNSLFTKERQWLRKKILNYIPQTYKIELLDYGEAIGTNQCLCVKKAELNTKTAALL